ncbi:hypothetical protein EMCRGX_G004094 [Ephydatia muelleri]
MAARIRRWCSRYCARRKAYHDHKDDFSSHSCSGVRATGIMLGKPPGVTTTNTSDMEQKENQAAVGS